MSLYKYSALAVRWTLPHWTADLDRNLLLELLIQPIAKRRKLLIPPQEILHHLPPRPRSALLDHRLAILRRRIAVQQIRRVKLPKEVQRNHLVIRVGVIVRRIAHQVAKAGIHAIALNPLPRLQALIK